MNHPARPTKRFQPNRRMEIIVPLLLIVLTVLLSGTILFLLLTLAGLLP